MTKLADFEEWIALARSGDADALLSALAAGEAVNATCEHTGTSALLVACHGNHVAAVRMLLEQGADPNYVDFDGYNAYDGTRNDDIHRFALHASPARHALTSLSQAVRIRARARGGSGYGRAHGSGRGRGRGSRRGRRADRRPPEAPGAIGLVPGIWSHERKMRGVRFLRLCLVGVLAVGSSCQREGPPAQADDSTVDALLARVDEVVQTPWRDARPVHSMKPAKVELAGEARGFTRLLDRESSLSISFRLLGASGAAAVSRNGLTVYPNAISGSAPLLHRVSEVGTEDFVFFERKPEAEELRYRVALGADVAGLRLVAESVEFLDQDGVPRLRMAPPWVLTSRASGSRRIDARVAVEGCAHDTRTADPRGRASTAPGGRECDIVVSWKGLDVHYPALVDPAWTTTGITANNHTSPLARLPDGRVLLVGGDGFSGSKSTEIYDPASGTWSSSANTAQNRVVHTLTVLDDGRVLVVGGLGNPPGVTAEVLDPLAPSPAWTSAGTLATTRSNHTATKLLDGRVLVAGGSSAPNSEIYNPVTNSWSFAGTNAVVRVTPTAQRLPDGRVFLAGGSASGNDSASSEIFDPAAAVNPWTKSVSFMFWGRTNPSSVLVGDKIFVAGGANTSATDVYNLTQNNWEDGPELPFSNTNTRLVAVNGGRILAYDNASHAAVYEPTAPGGALWWSILGLALPQRIPSVLLGTGKVLLAGGLGKDAWLFDLNMADYDGGACLLNGNCKNGNCKGGFCCDTPCTGTCLACRNSQTSLQDGKCGPALAGTDPFDQCLDEGSPTCNLNGACDGAGACQTYPAGPSCTPKPCTAGAQCASGFCVDGVCCDSACTDKCSACSAAVKGQGQDGVCGFIQANLDPNGECPGTMGTGACLGISMCDGAGACQTQATGNVCQASSCQNPSTQVNAYVCAKTGDCVANGITTCSPYVCSGSACLTSCTLPSQCALGSQCIGAQCVTQQANGLPCSGPSECQSTFCVEGVCCDGICDGECDSCNAANKAGGSSGTCGPRKAGAACGAPAACSNSSTLSTNACNGLGTCAATNTSCAPYVCQGSACTTSCISAADCTPPAACVASTCQAPDSGAPDSGQAGDSGETDSGTEDGSTTEDAGTSDGSPAEDGATGGSGGSTSSDSGTKGSSDESSDDGGCGCRLPIRTSGSGLLWIVSLSLLVVTARRRGRTHTSTRSGFAKDRRSHFADSQ